MINCLFWDFFEDFFEKKGFAEKCQFHVSANLGYLEAIKCNYEAKNRKCGPIFSRIQSYLIFCQLKVIILSWNTTELQGRLFQGFYERKRVYLIIASAKNTAVEKEGGLRDLCFLSLCFYRILFRNTWTQFFNF